MRTENAISVPLKRLQGQSPAVWNAPRAPVADDVGFDVEGLGQSGDAAGRLDGLVENSHGLHHTTNVRLKATIEVSAFIGMKTLAERLVHARTLKEWLQKDLSVASDVSMGMIGMLEKGKRGAGGRTPGSLPALAAALGVNYEWLAHGTGPMALPVITRDAAGKMDIDVARANQPRPQAQVGQADAHLSMRMEFLREQILRIPAGALRDAAFAKCLDAVREAYFDSQAEPTEDHTEAPPEASRSVEPRAQPASDRTSKPA